MLKDLDKWLDTRIDLARLSLLLVDLPQKETFRSGIGLRRSRQALIMRWENADGAYGYGECSARPDPFYSGEFVAASWRLTEDFIWPLLQNTRTYGEALRQLGRIRGWQFTKAAVELAMHDLLLRQDGKGMFGHWVGPRTAQIPVGISMGIYSDEGQLLAAAERNLAEGYRRLKFKISPSVAARPFHRLKARFPEAYLSFDANGTFWPKDLEALRAFADLGAPIEQPFPPGRFEVFRQVAEQLPALRICLDEEVTHLGALAAAQALGVLQELNLKPGRVGGLYESLRIADFCQQHQLPCWVGGMFESGIGRTFNLQVASLFPQARAHDLSPSSRYFLEDIVQQPIAMDANGLIHQPPVTNELDMGMVEKYLVRKVELS